MNIFWDIQSLRLVPSLSAVAGVSGYTLVLRDVYPITLAVCEPLVSESWGLKYAARPLASGESIAFALKKTDDLAGDSLIQGGTWVLSGTGTAARYAGQWNLNSQPLIDAVGSLSSLKLRAEFVLLAANNDHQCSTQFDLTVIPDVYRAAQTEPVALHNYVEPFTDEDGINKLRFVNADGVTVGIMAPP